MPAMAQPWRPRMAPERFDRQLSLAVVGDMGGGKTTLSVRFATSAFLPVLPTVGYEFHVRTVDSRDGRRIQVRVWDTAGQERHRALVPVLFRGVHGCLLVYDCTNAVSFAGVPAWAEALTDHTRTPVPCVLVANKTDLGEVRAVLPDEGAALARRLGAARFFETSAKDGSNVDAAFLALVDAILGEGGDEKEASEDSTVQLHVDGASRKCSGACII